MKTASSGGGLRVYKKRVLGQLGEDYACKMLLMAGLDILERNYRCPKGEIDVIAKENNTIIFVEVRTRSSSARGWGEESITPTKVHRLQAVASYYIVSHGFKVWPALRFDVVAIRWRGETIESNWVKAAI